MQPEDIGRLVLEHKWFALAAVIIGFLVRILHDDTKVPVTIPPRWKPVLALVLGVLAGVVGKIGNGMTWAEALEWGIGAGVTAILGHVFLVKSAAGGKELPIPGLMKKDEDPASPYRGPTVPPLPMLFMCLALAFGVGCGANQQQVVRSAARADIELTAKAGVAMQDICADVALAKKDLDLAKKCAAAYDSMRAALLGAEALVDGWDSASAGHFMCTMGHAVEALSQGVQAFTLAGGRSPPLIDDAISLGKQLAAGCSGGG